MLRLRDTERLFVTVRLLERGALRVTDRLRVTVRLRLGATLRVLLRVLLRVTERLRLGGAVPRLRERVTLRVVCGRGTLRVRVTVRDRVCVGYR